MENFLVFKKADGLDLDGARILGKDSMQEVEIREVVPVGGLYVDK